MQSIIINYREHREGTVLRPFINVRKGCKGSIRFASCSDLTDMQNIWDEIGDKVRRSKKGHRMTTIVSNN